RRALIPEVPVVPQVAVIPQIPVVPEITVGPQVAIVPEVAVAPEIALVLYERIGPEVAVGADTVARAVQNVKRARVLVLVRRTAVVGRHIDVVGNVQPEVGAIGRLAVNGVVSVDEARTLLEDRIRCLAL